MNKILKEHLTIFIILTLYFIFHLITDFYIPCPIHKIFHVYCPGCGVSRMLVSILKLDFVKAFNYNKLLFILFPFALFLYIEFIYSVIKKKEPLYKKIDNKVWYILIVILIIYAVLRNIIPGLAPIN